MRMVLAASCLVVILLSGCVYASTEDASDNSIQQYDGYRSENQEIIETVVQQCGMGMRSRAIKDSQINATSDYTAAFHGKYARLDETCPDAYYLGNSYGCWLALDKTTPLWLQIDLEEPRYVGGIITQGRPKHYPQWIKSFQISCGDMPAKMLMIKENGKAKTFLGNTNTHSPVMNMFSQPMLCRYIRFHPVSWQGDVALRMELVGGYCASVLWQPWEVWSECSSSCGLGLQVRKRLFVHAPREGNETRPCNTDLCDKYSKDKTTCIGKGKIPSGCKLDALVRSQLNSDFLGGSTQDIMQSADGKLKAKITRYKAPGMNIKFAKIRGEKKKEN